MFGDEKPPFAAQISAASGVARYEISARAAGLSLNMTITSPPPITTGPESLISGNAKTLKSVSGFAFVSEVMTPPTKSPSSTWAAFGGTAYTCVTEVGKSVCSALEVPPAIMGSVAGRAAYPNGSLYVTSKFAVHGFTQALREDLLGRPIRITNVAPGLVETDFSKVRFRGDEAKASAVYADVALGGPVRPEDVAECVLFALTRPANVNVDEIVVTALAQSSGARILREE